MEPQKAGVSDHYTLPASFPYTNPYNAYNPTTSSTTAQSTPSSSTATSYSSPPAATPSPVSSPSPSITTVYTSNSLSKSSSAPAPTVTVPSSETYTGPPSGWDSLGHGVKSGVAICIVVGILAVIIISLWFYCCRKKRDRSPDENRGLPLHTVNNVPNVEQSAVGGDAPPPRYEEVIPPQHQRLAGGISHVREDEEGMIADGKTPLSEIPFEDVVLDHTNSPAESSSSQTFSMRHHAGVGDTTGHTNS